MRATGADGAVSDTRGLAEVSEVSGLGEWLVAEHVRRRAGELGDGRGCLMLTARPAAGKTCLVSQLVVTIHSKATAGSPLVVIFVKVQQLQRLLLEPEHEEMFKRSWNWIDAYLRLEHTDRPALYRMLRQAMAARRTLLLLDGLDEGGVERERIERHIVEVLAPQGHVVLATSRPAGVSEEMFRGFARLQLKPLSEAQQQQAMERRVGAD